MIIVIWTQIAFSNYKNVEDTTLIQVNNYITLSTLLDFNLLLAIRANCKQYVIPPFFDLIHRVYNRVINHYRLRRLLYGGELPG